MQTPYEPDEKDVRAKRDLRRSRAIAAARAIASERGYDAVTMREVAEKAGIARASLYRYFSSKDHLLVEVSLEFSAEILKEVQAYPPKGETLADHVAYPFVLMLESVAREPKLLDATLRAYFSNDPEVRSLAAQLRTFGGLYVSAGLGTEIPRAAELARVLDPLSLAMAVGIGSGHITLKEAVDDFRSAVRLLVRERRTTR